MIGIDAPKSRFHAQDCYHMQARSSRAARCNFLRDIFFEKNIKKIAAARFKTYMFLMIIDILNP